MITAQTTELTYIDPRSNSDKFYRVFVLGSDVVTQYGRNGTFGTFGRKSYDSSLKAVTAAEKTVASKLAKGYNVVRSGELQFDGDPSDSDLDCACSGLTSGGGPVAMPTDRQESAAVIAANTRDEVDPQILKRVNDVMEKLGFTMPGVPAPANPTRPMLAKVVEPERVGSLIDNPQWGEQPKLDGDRVVVEIIDGTLSVLNRQGQPKVKNVGADMLSSFRHFTEGRWVFDGEVVGRTLWLFDMPAAGAYFDENACFEDRYEALVGILSILGCGDAVQLVPLALSLEDKNTMLEDAFANNKEGVIFREMHGCYEPGKRSTLLLKHKFVNDADCIVAQLNDGKESVTLAVNGPDGLQVVGTASTIGKSPQPQVGDVWEVRFLYVVSAEHPRMVQPRLMRLRTDKAPEDCSLDQFATAVTNRNPA